jgi:hypothetical protein
MTQSPRQRLCLHSCVPTRRGNRMCSSSLVSFCRSLRVRIEFSKSRKLLHYSDPIRATHMLSQISSHDNNAKPHTTVPRKNYVNSAERTVQNEHTCVVLTPVRQYIVSTSTGLNDPSPASPSDHQDVGHLSAASGASRPVEERPVEVLIGITPR